MHNRYKDPAYQEIIEAMKVQLRKLREELDETDAAYPDIQFIIDRYWDR